MGGEHHWEESPRGWGAPLGFPLSSHTSPQVSSPGAPRMGPDFSPSVFSQVTSWERWEGELNLVNTHTGDIIVCLTDY